MKRKIIFSVCVLVGMLVLVSPAPVVLAQVGQAQLDLPVANGWQSADGRSSAADAPARVGYGMIDVWVFVDADQNGVYSAGDHGLSGAQVCIKLGRRFSSCVGTDYGDTWWEDLRAGPYLTSIDPASLPPGASLRSIRCEETVSRAEYGGCRHSFEEWSTSVKLSNTTRLNIYFALDQKAGSSWWGCRKSKPSQVKVNYCDSLTRRINPRHPAADSPEHLWYAAGQQS